MAIRRSGGARALVVAAAVFATLGLPALHQLVHELEEAADDHPGEHGHDAPEHLGVALHVAVPTLALPPPLPAGAPPLPARLRRRPRHRRRDLPRRRARQHAEPRPCLLDSAWREAQLAETSRLAGEPAPVADIQFTPGTPRVVLLTVGLVVR